MSSSSSVSISASSLNVSGLTGELGVGTASILGGDATQEGGAATIIGSSGTIDTSSPLYLVAQSITATNNSPTTQALETGKLTTAQHNVLSALAAGGNKPYSIGWNNDGSEPTTLATMRSLGWIKLVEPDYNPSTRLVGSATYELTPVGQAIAKRTGAGTTTSNSVSVTA